MLHRLITSVIYITETYKNDFSKYFLVLVWLSLRKKFPENNMNKHQIAKSEKGGKWRKAEKRKQCRGRKEV